MENPVPGAEEHVGDEGVENGGEKKRNQVEDGDVREE
jgi:hypothetical protein